RAAADPHALFGHAIDDRRLAGLDHERRAAIDREFDRLAVAQIHQRVAGDAAFLLRAAGQMVHAAERQHLRAIFAGGDVADRLALRAHGRGFWAEIAIGVDLHLDAAIAEDAVGDDRDHVDAVDLGSDDERRRLVIGIGRAGADRGDENARFVGEIAVACLPSYTNEVRRGDEAYQGLPRTNNSQIEGQHCSETEHIARPYERAACKFVHKKYPHTRFRTLFATQPV